MDGIQLAPDVHDELLNSFMGDNSHLSHLLQVLSKPPMFSTLRISLQHTNMENALGQVKTYFAEQCKLKGLVEFTMYPHPDVPDCLVIENRGPVTLQPVDKEIIVDLSCGMAVQRGANVFAQGIIGCPQSLREGDIVSVFCDLDGKCLKGAIGYKGRTLLVGNGVSQVARGDLYNAQGGLRGIGILMTSPLYEAPSLSDLPFPWASAQNLPSIACGHLLEPLPHHRVLDMCAAPGGKTSHIADLLGNAGEVIALEKSSRRCSEMASLMSSLGHTNVTCFTTDAIQAVGTEADANRAPPYLPGSFDRILVDAPCSALGQRPAAINRMTTKSLKSFPVLQQKLLSTAVQLLSPGGLLVYSTCTVTLEENEGQVARLLERWPTMELLHPPYKLGGPGLPNSGLTADQLTKVQRFDPSILISETDKTRPRHDIDTIGFFIAKFRKKL